MIKKWHNIDMMKHANVIDKLIEKQWNKIQVIKLIKYNRQKYKKWESTHTNEKETKFTWNLKHRSNIVENSKEEMLT